MLTAATVTMSTMKTMATTTTIMIMTMTVIINIVTTMMMMATITTVTINTPHQSIITVLIFVQCTYFENILAPKLRRII